MSNTTHKSVPTLMSSAGCEAYDSLYYRKGIITAFNEVGYKTAFYSNQQRNHSFIDAFGSEAQEVEFLKDKVSLMELRSENFDDDLIDCVKKRLEKYDGGKLFIVVHMYGSHSRPPPNIKRPTLHSLTSKTNFTHYDYKLSNSKKFFFKVVMRSPCEASVINTPN